MFQSKEKQFKQKVQQSISSSLDEIGKVVVSSVKGESPVITGALRDATDSEVDSDVVIIYNTVEYAPFVEFGTYRMGANPFMRRGVARALPALVTVIKKNLGV